MYVRNVCHGGMCCCVVVLLLSVYTTQAVCSGVLVSCCSAFPCVPEGDTGDI